MKRIKKSGLFGFMMAAMVIFGAANLANAAIVNLGFETGNYNGWTIAGSGNATVVGSYLDGNRYQYSPPDGLYFLKLDSPSGSISAYQNFSANSGDKISGWAGLYTGTSGGLSLTLMISGYAYPLLTLTSDTTGWVPWSWTAPGSGPYTLQYTLIGSSTSAAVFDAVPIPTTALLLGSGLIGLVIIRRRMKK